MRPGQGKAKGSEFERTQCKLLSSWVSSGEDDNLLYRSAMSGGRSTLSLARTGSAIETQAGDVSLISAHAEAAQFMEHFTVEAKFEKDLNLISLVYAGVGDTWGIKAHWQQACRDASSVSKRPILVAKQNRKPVLMGVDRPLYVSLRALCARPPAHFVVVPSINLVLFDQAEFLERVPYVDFKKIYPTINRRRVDPATSSVADI